MSEGDIGYSVIKQYADLGKRIDDKGAREIAKGIFGIEDSAIEKAKAYTVKSYIRALIVPLQPEGLYSWWFRTVDIPVVMYGYREGNRVYYVNFGYDPENNIIVYAQDIRMNKI